MAGKNRLFNSKNLIAGSVLAAGIVASASAQMTRYHSNGDSACTTGQVGSGWISLCVYTNKLIGEGRDNQPKSALLEYYGYDNGVWMYGFGQIPLSAVKFGGGSATLTVNTLSLPDFPSGSPFSGPISVTWTTDGLYTTRYHANGQTTYGTIRRHFNGEYETSSANANGNIFGYSLTNWSGYIGETRNLDIEVGIQK